MDEREFDERIHGPIYANLKQRAEKAEDERDTLSRKLSDTAWRLADRENTIVILRTERDALREIYAIHLASDEALRKAKLAPKTTSINQEIDNELSAMRERVDMLMKHFIISMENAEGQEKRQHVTPQGDEYE